MITKLPGEGELYSPHGNTPFQLPIQLANVKGEADYSSIP